MHSPTRGRTSAVWCASAAYPAGRRPLRESRRDPVRPGGPAGCPRDAAEAHHRTIPRPTPGCVHHRTTPRPTPGCVHQPHATPSRGRRHRPCARL